MMKYVGMKAKFSPQSGALDHVLPHIGGNALRAAITLGPRNLKQLKEIWETQMSLMVEAWGEPENWYSLPDVSFSSKEMKYFSNSGDTILLIEEAEDGEWLVFWGRAEGANYPSNFQIPFGWKEAEKTL